MKRISHVNITISACNDLVTRSSNFWPTVPIKHSTCTLWSNEQYYRFVRFTLCDARFSTQEALSYDRAPVVRFDSDSRAGVALFSLLARGCDQHGQHQTPHVARRDWGHYS